MFEVFLKFHDGLNFFLEAARRKGRFARRLREPTSVKDLIESCGVPHPEVDVILANGQPVVFGSMVKAGDEFEVYPVLTPDAFEPAVRLQQRPLLNAGFVADGHLGKLARYLRILGFDVAYDPMAEDAWLIEIMRKDSRALLTRDRRLLMHKVVRHGFCPRSQDAGKQTVEVVRRFGLADALRPFQRCMACNGLLRSVPKDLILDKLEPKTRLYYQKFSRCSSCEKIYWQGSHYRPLQDIIETIKRETKSSN